MATKPKQQVLFTLGPNETASLTIHSNSHPRKTYSVRGPCEIVAVRIAPTTSDSSADTSDGGASLTLDRAIRNNSEGEITKPVITTNDDNVGANMQAVQTIETSKPVITTNNGNVGENMQAVQTINETAKDAQATQASQRGQGIDAKPDSGLPSLNHHGSAFVIPKPSPFAAAVIARMENYMRTATPAADPAKLQSLLASLTQSSAAQNGAEANSRPPLPATGAVQDQKLVSQEHTNKAKNAASHGTASSTKAPFHAPAKIQTGITKAPEPPAVKTCVEANPHAGPSVTGNVRSQKAAFRANTKTTSNAAVQGNATSTKATAREAGATKDATRPPSTATKRQTQTQTRDADAQKIAATPVSPAVEVQPSNANTEQETASAAWTNIMRQLRMLNYDDEASTHAFWRRYLTYQKEHSGDGLQPLGLASEQLSIVIGADQHADSTLPVASQKCQIHNLFYARRAPLRIINLGVLYHREALTGWILGATAEHVLVVYKMETQLGTFRPEKHTWAPAIYDKCGGICGKDKTSCANNWIEDVTVVGAGTIADLVRSDVAFNVREKQRVLGTYGLYFT
ncbi:hypothetical protein BP5796_00952 [Coleophoma crateriformis]|uniref:Uncharacterized protein n=1 Tax=Coleophoma crateriformis TaxID=565419 RepID=A0A3D8T9D8_9HELO|nr:hypothetical protein BP5796_00952 [Coleophoma crateriformis]